MTIEETLSNPELSIEEKMNILKDKNVKVRPWTGEQGLEKEYNPRKHWVMDRAKYQDLINEDNKPEMVTRVVIDLQRLAAQRMTDMTVGIPVKRVYKPENDKQKEVAKYIEKIYNKARIDSINIDRLDMLNASCEFMTIWYATAEPNNLYGFKSPLKLRCKTFSPMSGDQLYPLFDVFGDMKAMSVAYSRKVHGQTVHFFDCYTAKKHYCYSTQGKEGAWSEIMAEDILIGKIPCVYCYRPTPIWEDNSTNVDEMEKSLSRNGNYLRKNSKPLFVVFADEQIQYGDEKSQDEEFKAVMQYPKGGSAGYVTWPQSVDSLKYQVSELRSLFFAQLQLPDWNYEKMSQQALSGESRKQLNIDGKCKVKHESGRLLEAFDRETNIIRAYLKCMLPNDYEADIDALPCDQIITPFELSDEKETIDNLLAANGNKPILSQRESIIVYGKSEDPDKTLEEIQQDNKADAFNLAE